MHQVLRATFRRPVHRRWTPVAASYYDRNGGVLVYSLKRPSRVHIQAGCSALNPTTKKMEGPVLKTIVNREPRVAGRILESWRGFDDSSAIYVPDLPNFVIAIATTPLPENSIITFGNHTTTFVDEATRRTGASLLRASFAQHSHHAGLSTLDDTSPSATVEPVGGKWDPLTKVWAVRGNPSLRMSLTGPAATRFAGRPARIAVYADGHEVVSVTPNGATFAVVQVSKLPVGLHTIAMNWISEYGPVAVGAARLVVSESDVVNSIGGAR